MSREILPTHLSFTHYTLMLSPDLSAFTFGGTVKINFTCHNPTNVITLNAKELTVNDVMLTIGNLSISPLFIGYDEETERLMIFFQDIIQENVTGSVVINYTGKLNDKMCGFYRSKYLVGEEERWMATTQFEPTDARRAFPCADEPALKATFQVSMVIPENLDAISNTEVESVDIISGEKIINFKQTPIMSTYLLAFCVGELEYIETNTTKPNSGENLRIRVYTTPGHKEEGQFALELAAKVLVFFSDYFGIDYPLEKMDMIGIPDFASGAMENWGLVTYRTGLILTNDNTSLRTYKQVAYVICHELAHQWFGNLVTMDWWSGLWLNEGFATWVGWMATDHFYPEWKIWDSFIGDELLCALSLDQLDSSHPVENAVLRAKEVDEVFDAISYSKGSCIIRMLVSALSEETFKNGIRKYLQAHAYGNASTDDLWNALSTQSGQDVSTMMNTWVKQTGYPVCSVTSVDNHLLISQERYFSTRKEDPIHTEWIVPLTIATEKNNTIDVQNVMLSSNVYSCPDNGSWYKVNWGQTGFYRTRYSSNLLARMNMDKLSVVDRTDLITNAFAFAKSGYGNVCDVLTLVPAYKNENDPNVLQEILFGLNTIRALWHTNNAIVKYINNTIHDLVASKFTQLGFDGSDEDTHEIKLLRPIVISALISAEHPEVILECNNRMERFFNGDENAIGVDLRRTGFACFVRYGGEREFNIVKTYHQQTTIDELRNAALMALGRTQNDTLLREAFDYAFKTDYVRSQDSFLIVRGIGAKTGQIGWNILMDNWSVVVERYKDRSHLFDNTIYGLLSNLHTREAYEAAKAFLNSHSDDTKVIKTTLQQTYENMEANLAWIDRDSSILEQYVTT